MIEGTRSTVTDLLLFELGQEGQAPTADAREVSRYVAALDHGLKRLRGGFPLSSRLIREVHRILMRGGEGQHADPGEYRRTENWIGGTRPGNAAYVPPPARCVCAPWRRRRQAARAALPGLPADPVLGAAVLAVVGMLAFAASHRMRCTSRIRRDESGNPPAGA